MTQYETQVYSADHVLIRPTSSRVSHALHNFAWQNFAVLQQNSRSVPSFCTMHGHRVLKSWGLCSGKHLRMMYIAASSLSMNVSVIFWKERAPEASSSC